MIIDKKNSSVFGEDGDYENRFYDWDHGSDYITEREWEANRKALNDSFEPNGDTHFQMTLSQYLEAIRSEGFEEVLKTDFTHSHCGRERSDSYYIFAHRKGWLITLDTYTSDYGFHEGVDQGFAEPSANTIELHYNWTPASLDLRGSLTSNGGFIRYPNKKNEKGDVVEWGDLVEPNTWGGHHDVRGGLKHVMNSLLENGSICNPWMKNVINWMTPHHSVKEQDRSITGDWDRWLSEMNQLTDVNFGNLPEWVKNMIGKPCQ